MYLDSTYQLTRYKRISKLGIEHEHMRKKTVLIFRCDNCKDIFYRDKKKVSPKRLSNNYFHCCSNCDPKKFAQKKGVERRTIWDRPASSLDDISQL
jgi:hypothetical protein